MTQNVYPVFPLPVVAFPGHALPLRIFEARYLRMLEDIRESRHFVIALIRSGPEVGGEAMPYPVGTLASYTKVSGSGEVRRIDPVGQKRVYLHRMQKNEKPYLQAECRDFADEAWTDGDRQTLRDLEAALLMAAEKHAPGTEGGVTEAFASAKAGAGEEHFSLFLCGCLALPPPYRQGFLESRLPGQRMRQALHYLKSAESKSASSFREPPL